MKLIDAAELTQVAVLNPAAITATGAQTTGTDLAQFDGRVKLLVNVGAVTGTTPTLDIRVTDCNTVGGTYADVSPAQAFAQLVTGSANSVVAIHVDTDTCRQFIKLAYTAGGTTPSFTLGAVLVGQKQVI